MADIKLNVVGHSKLIAMALTFGLDTNSLLVNCFACEAPLNYTEMQVDHISHRNGILYGDSELHRLANLCPLCKKCNSAKGKMEAQNFYGKKKFAKLQKIVSRPVDIKDARVKSACIKLAKSLISRKFSRTFAKQKSTGNGLYFKPDAVYDTDIIESDDE